MLARFFRPSVSRPKQECSLVPGALKVGRRGEARIYEAGGKQIGNKSHAPVQLCSTGLHDDLPTRYHRSEAPPDNFQGYMERSVHSGESSSAEAHDSPDGELDGEGCMSGTMGRSKLQGNGESSKMVMAKVKEALSWQELRQLLYTHPSGMSMIIISAMVSRLPKVCPQPKKLPAHERFSFEHFLGQVSALVLQHFEELDGRAIANILWAVVKLGYSPSDTLLDRFLYASYIRMHSLKPQELSSIGWALATMRHCPSESWFQRYEVHVAKQLSNMKPQEVANVAWALPRISSGRHTQALMKHLCRRALDVTREASTSSQAFKSHELIMLLCGICSLPGGQIEAERVGLLEESWFQLSNEMDYMNSLELTNWISLMARTSFEPPGKASCVKWQHQTSASSAPCSLAGEKAECVTDYGNYFSSSLPHLPSMTSLSLCRTAWAVAKLGLQPPEKWTHGMLHALLQRRYVLGSQGLVIAIWAVAKMDLPSSALSPSWVQAMLQVALLQLPALNARELSAFAVSLTRLKCIAACKLPAVLHETVKRVLPEMGPLEAGTMLRGLVMTGMQLPPSLVESLLHVSVSCPAGATSLTPCSSSYPIPPSGDEEPSATTRDMRAGESSALHGRVVALAALSGLPSSQLPESWLEKIEAALTPDVNQLDQNQTVMVLESYARVASACEGYEDGRDTCGLPGPELVEHVLESIMMQLSTYNSGQLTRILHALATLHYRPSLAWMEDVVAEVETQLHEFGVREMSHLLWALTKMEFELPRYVLASCLRVAHPRLATAAAKDVARLAWALSPFERRYASCLVPRSQVSQAAEGRGESSLPSMGSACDEGVPSSSPVHSLRGKDTSHGSNDAANNSFSRLLWAFRLQLVKSVSQNALHFPPEELSWFLRSCVAAGNISRVPYWHWDRLLKQGVLPRLDEFSAKQFRVLIWSLSESKHLRRCSPCIRLALASRVDAQQQKKQQHDQVDELPEDVLQGALEDSMVEQVLVPLPTQA